MPADDPRRSGDDVIDCRVAGGLCAGCAGAFVTLDLTPISWRGRQACARAMLNRPADARARFREWCGSRGRPAQLQRHWRRRNRANSPAACAVVCTRPGCRGELSATRRRCAPLRSRPLAGAPGVVSRSVFDANRGPTGSLWVGLVRGSDADGPPSTARHQAQRASFMRSCWKPCALERAETRRGRYHRTRRGGNAARRAGSRSTKCRFQTAVRIWRCSANCSRCTWAGDDLQRPLRRVQGRLNRELFLPSSRDEQG